MTTALHFVTVPRRDTGWQDRARCVGVDVERFYPPGETGEEKGAAKTAVALARAFCRRCPVKADCLEYALALPAGQDHGVWGGTSRFHRMEVRAGRRTPEEILP